MKIIKWNQTMSKLITTLALAFCLTGCMATYGGKDPVSQEGQLVRYTYQYENQKTNKNQIRQMPFITSLVLKKMKNYLPCLSCMTVAGGPQGEHANMEIYSPRTATQHLSPDYLTMKNHREPIKKISRVFMPRSITSPLNQMSIKIVSTR